MNQRRPRPARVVAVVTLSTVIAVGLGGCTSAGTKAGPASPAVTLHLATVENSGADYIDDARRFAADVAELTGGSVTIQLDFEVVDPWTPQSEQAVTAMVKAGSTDLAFVPPRVFDTVGIHGFEALQTPMLIDSPEVAGAITTGDIGAGLLAGLSGNGLVGLGLFYDGLRRPLALQGAITAAGQFDGLLIRVPISGVGFEMFRALGAIPDSATSHRVATTGAPYSAVETQFEIAWDDYPTGSTMTANVVFYPKFNALVANPAAFDRLTSDQQDAIRLAAAHTAAAAVATTGDDEALAAQYCEDGSHVLLAPAPELAAIHDRVTPLVDRMRADPATGTVIAAIEQLASTLVIPEYHLPPACALPTGDGARLPSTPPGPSP